jgi:DNA-binding response OmpR family regulator
LEEYGYNVLDAADGVAGQEIFRQQMDRIRLVLCDLIMPGLDGRETLQGIWERKRDVKAIIISGYTADVIAKKGLANADVQLLMKPLTPGILLKKVRAVLDEG